jgi:GAF domain-containing protein
VSSAAARLELLCDVNRRLATFASLDELVAWATQRARELFDAEGCALLLVDHGGREFRFPVASLRAGSPTTPARLQEVCFPTSQGVAGWVLAHGQAIAIADAQNDPRFYKGVDDVTGSTTRSLLAAPLRTSTGTIGVVEVVNPSDVGEGDVAFLEALGSDIAVAYERAAVSAALRAEAAGLRRLAQLGGAALGVLGLGCVLAAMVAHGARALPASELVTEPGVLLGAIVGAAGLVLALAVRRVPSRG